MGIILGGLLIAFAAVIGDIEAAAFEKEAGAGADGAFDFSLSPGFAAAKVLRTNGQRLGGDGLKLFKFMSALLTDVFVSRHTKRYSNSSPVLRVKGNVASDACMADYK